VHFHFKELAGHLIICKEIRVIKFWD